MSRIKLSGCVRVLASILAIGLAVSAIAAEDEGADWVSIFNGENLDGWRASENPQSFKVEDGIIVAHGPRAHLFYEGSVADADFEDFEFKCKVYTYPEANSGVFFHTEYQERGWPGHGYEAQINVTHSDSIKTGSIYAVKNILDNAPHEDHEWFELYIRVDGDRIVVKVDGEVVIEYTEDPADISGNRRLSSGTFALQAHDPNSRMYFKNIYVRMPSD